MTNKTDIGTSFNIDVKYPPTYDNVYQKNGSIMLATSNSERYLNVMVRGNGCLTSAAARDLRDTLNRIYPGEAEVAPKAKKATPKGAQAYKGNGKHDWERVAPDTMRLRVPGGWLYRNDLAMAVSFVPVPEAVGYAV